MNGQLDLSLRGHRSGLITVTDLVRRVRAALDASLGEGWVVGEIRTRGWRRRIIFISRSRTRAAQLTS